MRYLLDTNIVSDMMRNPQGRVFQRIAKVGEDAVLTSIIVSCEVRFGIEKRQSQKLAKRFSDVFGTLRVERLDKTAEGHYADIRTRLEAMGNPIGQMDMLIAAHALALDAIVVTDNEREFSRVPGLKVENWLR